MIMYIVW